MENPKSQHNLHPPPKEKNLSQNLYRHRSLHMQRCLLLLQPMQPLLVVTQELSNEARTTDQPHNDNLSMETEHVRPQLPANYHLSMGTLSVNDFIIHVCFLYVILRGHKTRRGMV